MSALVYLHVSICSLGGFIVNETSTELGARYDDVGGLQFCGRGWWWPCIPILVIFKTKLINIQGTRTDVHNTCGMWKA